MELSFVCLELNSVNIAICFKYIFVKLINESFFIVINEVKSLNEYKINVKQVMEIINNKQVCILFRIFSLIKMQRK